MTAWQKDISPRVIDMSSEPQKRKMNTKSCLAWKRWVGTGRQLHLQRFSDKSSQNEKMNRYWGCFSEVRVKLNQLFTPMSIIMPFWRLGDAGNGRQLHLNSSWRYCFDSYEAEAFLWRCKSLRPPEICTKGLWKYFWKARGSWNSSSTASRHSLKELVKVMKIILFWL